MVLVVLGAALRLWQYAANSSLWIDELALSHNIIDRSFSALLRPLDYAQIAPPGFLLVQKTLITLFGSSEYTLRAFPLVGGLVSLGLFWAVAKKILSGWAVTYAVGLFSLSIPFIYFSSQMKQYSTDVAATLFILLLTLRARERGMTGRDGFWLGIAGAVTAWFSQPAVFVMAGIGGGLLILTLTERNHVVAKRLLLPWTLWGVSAVAVAAHSMSSVPPLDGEYFRWFWADGFMPIPARTAADLAWLPGKFTWVFGGFALGLGPTNGGLNYRWSHFFAIVMLYGFFVLGRRQRPVALFLLLPTVIVVMLSAASLYPFTARVIAFLIPFFLIATATGASHLLTNLPRPLQFLTPFLMALLGGSPIYAIATTLPPSRVQHVRPILEHVKRERVVGDRIYVYYGANPAFGYYAPRIEIQPEGVVSGRCHLADPRSYLRELDRLRGSARVWLVATHVQRSGELEQILAYLDRIGRRVDAITVDGAGEGQIEDAYGYLYDLSDRQRLASASADTYQPVLAPVTGPWRVWGCYGVVDQPRY